MDLPALAPAFAALAIGYLFGSVPFGLLIARIAGAGDIRKIGSGNIGATNVLRTGNKGAAVATLLCDAGKGAAAVLAARALLSPPQADVFAALGATLGHLFPVWLGFRGGKGVATTFGIMLALDWRVGLLAGVTWAAVAFASRISSLSALIAAILTPLYMFLMQEPRYGALAIITSLLVILTHRENIDRLRRGEEPRIGAGKRIHGPSA